MQIKSQELRTPQYINHHYKETTWKKKKDIPHQRHKFRQKGKGLKLLKKKRKKKPVKSIDMERHKCARSLGEDQKQ